MKIYVVKLGLHWVFVRVTWREKVST